MVNIDIYNSRMAAAMQDKLWFVNFLPEDEEAIVYDFGCADGTLIRYLAESFPKIKFVGVDNSNDMIRLAKQRQMFPNESYIFYNDNIEMPSEGIPRFLIMSSVWHEIFHYEYSPEKFVTELFDKLNPDVIFFRDMCLDNSTYRDSDLNDELKIYQYGEEFQIEDYVNLYGKRAFVSQRNVLDYLLKYRYKENWLREYCENYFHIGLEMTLKLFEKLGYNCYYKEHFILPYIKEIVKKDFDIDIKDKTHLKAVFCKKSFE